MRSEIAITSANLKDATASALDIDGKLNFLNMEKTKMPLHTRWHELKGDLLLRKATISKIYNAAILEKAAAAYRDAINAEPARASIWIKFVFAKALQKKFDNDFYYALDRAYHYGGWEAGVSQLIVKIGLYNSHSLDASSLTLVKESMRRLYLVKPREVMELAQHSDQLRLTCIWINNLNSENAVCKKELLEN